jgi:hypothetical protein
VIGGNEVSDMESVSSHLLVYIPAYNKYPLDKARKMFEGYAERSERMRAARQKAIPTFEEYIEKIAKPRLEAFIKSLNPEFVSRAGLTAEQIIRKQREKLFSSTAYENYIKDIPVEQILDKIPLNAAKYATKMTFGDWRLVGSLTTGGASAMKIVLGWLDGNLPEPARMTIRSGGLTSGQAGKKITSAFRRQDKLIQGEPVLVTLPERIGEFKRELRTLLRRVLDIIQCAHYAPSVVAKQNDRLNQFMNDYRCPELEPFSTGGVSHIDFIVVRESVIPADSKEVKEIEYKIYSFFIGEAKAKHIRATSIEKEYHYPLNPDDYIGNPNQKAYFDMYLDIQVAGKAS